MLNGHCECGAVRYQINGEIHDFSHCHCSQCRRLHGAAFATFAGVAKSDVSWVSGEDALNTYFSSPSHERVFCSHRGSNLYVALDSEPDDYYLSLSSVDGNPELPDGYHIFVDSKAPWHTIQDGLPQYAEDADD